MKKIDKVSKFKQSIKLFNKNIIKINIFKRIIIFFFFHIVGIFSSSCSWKKMMKKNLMIDAFFAGPPFFEIFLMIFFFWFPKKKNQKKKSSKMLFSFFLLAFFVYFLSFNWLFTLILNQNQIKYLKTQITMSFKIELSSFLNFSIDVGPSLQLVFL